MDGENRTPAVIPLIGRIDSGNADRAEEDIRSKLGGNTSAVLDAERLDYISSAGLRVVLRLRKICPDLKIINVNSDVYEILDMTGFTEMIPVEKAYRRISVEGCEVIGEGANGKVYRIDKDNVVKTYKNADALSAIRHEREVARLALVLGVPTAISYDVVRVGDSYGSVFELLNADSFAKILARGTDRFDFCVRENVKMLKTIHGITVPEGKLPSIRDKELKAVRRMKDSLPDGLGDKLLRMAEAIPESNRMVHGDFHTKNIVLAGGEVLVIDMDTLSVGEPIFDFVHMYNAYRGYGEYDPGVTARFQGYPSEVAVRFWKESLKEYLGTDDEDRVREAENKIRILSYSYLIDWWRRHSERAPASCGEGALGLWTERLIQLLHTTDDLDLGLGGNEATGGGEPPLTLEASVDRLPEVLDYVGRFLERAGCPAKIRMQVDLAAEEIFVNIARYAYAPGTGDATVAVSMPEAGAVTISFSDTGRPYNPLGKDDPDVSLSAEERQIGGLGIFMTKQVMDELSYEYRDGRNILNMTKRF